MEAVVTIEVGSQASGWRFANEASCAFESADMILTARTLWDETKTQVQGRKKRTVISVYDGDEKLMMRTYESRL